MPDSNTTNANGEHNSAESTTKKDELRVKNVFELNEGSSTIEDGVPAENNATPSQNKRKLPSWMLSASSSLTQETQAESENSASKRLKTVEGQNSNEQSNDENPLPVVDENPATNNSNADADSATVSSNIKTEPADTNEMPSTTDDNVGDISTNGTNAADVKDEPTSADADTAASTSTGIQNTNNIKPAVKVEKADATSTSRESCKYGIRCYRRNPMHRIEEAHPGDHDYKRPDFPTPPLGTPACPFGSLCYRRNPTHFQLYSHPVDTDFQKNYRLRKRQQRQQQQNNADDDNSDLDDYDLDDPFINDDSDQDYVPSDDDIDDTEEFNDDDCDKAEE